MPEPWEAAWVTISIVHCRVVAEGLVAAPAVMPATFYDDIITVVACYNFYPAAAPAFAEEELAAAPPPTLAEFTEVEPCLAVSRPDLGA